MRGNWVRAWWPFAMLAVIVVLLAMTVASDGRARIWAWYQSLSLLPLLGTIYVIGAIVRIAWKRTFTPAIAATLVLALVAMVPLTWSLRVWPMAFPASAAETEPKLEIRVPTDAPMRVAWGGDAAAGNYHAIASDQRWAYDLVVAPYFNGSTELTDYGCYGISVVAPIDGEVVRAADDQPDETPGAVSNNLTAPFGNHVVIAPDGGGYLFVAHLQPGSIVVAPGDRVLEGEVIGACGNSGNTTEPHVHVHYQRQRPGELPMNFADGLPLYFRDHEGPPMPVGGLARGDGVVSAAGDVIVHRGY